MVSQHLDLKFVMTNLELILWEIKSHQTLLKIHVIIKDMLYYKFSKRMR